MKAIPQEQGDDQAERASIRSLAADPIAWIIVVILTFGVVSEVSAGSWLVYYLERVHAWDTERASGMLSLFFLFFMLSRLLLGPVTDKIGYTLSIVLFAAFSGLCSLAAIVFGEPAAWLFAVAGIGIAPVYPTVMAILAKRYARGTDAAITFTVTLMGIGSVLGNLLIGYIMDWMNLKADYGVIALLALLCSFTALLLYVLLRKQKELV